MAFVYEPIAAAYHYEETASGEETVLIADIGGGTSDFTVIRIGPERRARADRSGDILSNAGVRIGGTDFDSLLSLDAVMPLLGLGTHLIEKNLPMPNSLYFELATWPTINFTYTFQNERMLLELVAGSREPEKVTRLLKVIRARSRSPHRFRGGGRQDRAERSADRPAAARLRRTLARGDRHAPRLRRRHRSRKTERLHQTAAKCIRDAGFKRDAIHTIFFTGGSSRVPAVREAIARAAPDSARGDRIGFPFRCVRPDA